MSAFAPRNWFPDERPGKPEVAIAALVLLDVAYGFYTGEVILWPWFVAGFLACVVALGPVAAAPLGSRIGTWFRDIGVAGRALVIIAFAVVVWIGYEFSVLPPKPLSSAANGTFLAITVVVAVRLLTSRSTR